MNVKPRSTQRTLRAHQDALPGREEITAERDERGQARARALALILGHGCGVCWGRQDIRVGPKGESVLYCPILTEAAAGAEIRKDILKAAEGCRVPRLYQRAEKGERTDVTPEEVAKLIPRLEEDGELETLREADPEAPLRVGGETEAELPETKED